MPIRVIKVYEDGCPVCETMSRYDQSVFLGYPSIGTTEIRFEEIQDHYGKPFLQRIYQLLEEHAVSSTYEIDFPTYLFLGEKDTYLGHLQGSMDLQEFRERVKEIMVKLPSE